MTKEPASHHHRSPQPRVARLFLNGTEVGAVALRGHDGSWGFGEFMPSPEFSAFAPVFGRWSLLMHAEGSDRMSEAASDELRAAEYEIDAIRAALFLENMEEWRHLRQINIDGTLIEWKED
jgi:hypothetical protein